MSYSIFDYCVMFGGTFAMVFLLGIQSRNVVAGKYFAAILTSFGISVGNFMFVKFAATGDPVVFALSALGGCCGISSSIWFYKHVIEKKFATGGFIKQKKSLPLWGARDDIEAYFQLPIKTVVVNSITTKCAHGVKFACLAEKGKCVCNPRSAV